MSATGADTYLAMIKQDPTTPLVMPTTPLLQKVAYAKCDLGSQIATSKSKNITGNRRLADIAITGFTISGGYEAEMTYEASLDDEMILNALMCEQWTTDVAKDGTFVQPMYMELAFVSVSEYMQYFGMVVNEWTMAYKDQAMVEQSFTLIGLKETLVKVVSTGATYTEVTGNPVFSTVTNVSDIKIDGAASGQCEVKEWDVKISNGITPKTGVGVLGACSTNAHAFDIEGSFTAYFEDTSLKAKLLNGTAFSFEWTVKDAAGNGYTFLLPKCKLDSNTNPIDGQDSDVMNNASFVGLGDTVTGCSIQVTRIHP